MGFWPTWKLKSDGLEQLQLIFIMVMAFMYRIFYVYIFKCGLHLSHVQG